MRNVFLWAALLCMANDPCSAQHPTVAELLAGLRSEDANERTEALDHLRADPVALRDSKVKAALVGLLDRENKEPVHSEEEGFAEYRSWLADTVAKIVDWKNPRQVCILANSVDLPDELSDHARVAVPCLLARLTNGLNRYTPGVDISRGSVVAMLVQALAKGRSDLHAASADPQHPLWKPPLSEGEKRELGCRDQRRRKGIPITEFFNSHGIFQQL